MDSEEFCQRSSDFLAWLQQQEGTVISPKLKLADLRTCGAGRAVFAVEDIKEGEELFTIPHHAVLNVSNSDLSHKLYNDLATLDPWLSLVLVMIYEYGKGQSSKWWPYWQVLPDHFDTLVYWSPSELAELQGSAVLSKIGKGDADRAFAEILMPLAIKHADFFGKHATAFEGPAAEATFLPLAHRMATLIMAYAFDIEHEERVQEVDEDGYLPDDEEDPPKGMVPLADMLNADGDRNNARLYHGESTLTLTAIANIQTGEEIFNDYGSLPRSDLLRRYGYITDEYKKWDVVELDMDKLIKVIVEEMSFIAGDLDKRSNFAKKMGLWEDAFDIARQAGNESLSCDGFDPALIQTLQILTASDEKLKALRDARKPPEHAMNSLTAKVLHKALSDRQKEYNTSIAQDSNLLRRNEIEGRHRLAIEIRLGEKEIIAAALHYLNHKINALTSERIMGGSSRNGATSNGDMHPAKKNKK